MAQSFKEAVSDWCRQSEQRLERTWQTAVGDLATEMTRTEKSGGKVPHKTGNLANSLLGSTAGPPSQGGKDEKFSGMDVGAFAATLKLGDTAWMGYRAVYSRRLNYGFVGEDSLGRTYNQSGRHFVEHAIGQWPQIVTEAARKVQDG